MGREPGRSAEPGLGQVLRDRRFLAFLALQLAFILPLWQFQVALPMAMLAEGHGPAVFGRVLAVNGVLIMLLQPWLAAWSAGRDPFRLLAAGFLLVGSGYGAYAFCHGALAFGVATAVWSVGEIVVMPVAAATVAAFSPPALRGRYQGAWTLAFGLGMALAPVLGSACMDRFGAPALWGACLAVAIPGALGVVALGARVRGRATAGSPPLRGDSPRV